MLRLHCSLFAAPSRIIASALLLGSASMTMGCAATEDTGTASPGTADDVAAATPATNPTPPSGAVCQAYRYVWSSPFELALDAAVAAAPDLSIAACIDDACETPVLLASLVSGERRPSPTHAYVASASIETHADASATLRAFVGFGERAAGTESAVVVRLTDAAGRELANATRTFRWEPAASPLGIATEAVGCHTQPIDAKTGLPAASPR